MTSQQLERASYQAAHKILSTDFYMLHLACPGGRRSAQVDKLAEIIMETMTMMEIPKQPIVLHWSKRLVEAQSGVE